MNYQITSDNIEVSPSMIELAKEKLSKVGHHLVHVPDDLVIFRVVLNKAPKDLFEVKVEASIKGKSFFSHATHHVLESAIILTVEELDRQLEKEKVKKNDPHEWEEKRELKRFSDIEDSKIEDSQKG